MINYRLNSSFDYLFPIGLSSPSVMHMSCHLSLVKHISVFSSSLPHSLTHITISMSYLFPSHLHDNSTRKVGFYEGGIQRAGHLRGYVVSKVLIFLILHFWEEGSTLLLAWCSLCRHWVKHRNSCTLLTNDEHYNICVQVMDIWTHAIGFMM